MSFEGDAYIITDEIRAILENMDFDQISPFVDELLQADTIATYGVGREGLMMKSFTMRLMHLGMDAHVVGNMTTPPVGQGDLLLTSAGPGYFSTVNGLIETAHDANARVSIVTAQPHTSMVRNAETVLTIPAHTMTEDVNEDVQVPSEDTIQPMGCTFEQAQFVVFDTIVLQLMDELGETTESMSQRHTNLE